MGSHLPLNVFRSHALPGHEGINALDVRTNCGKTVGEALKEFGEVTPLNWKKGQKGIIAHRGSPGYYHDSLADGRAEKGELIPECTVAALEKAYQRGIKCSEADSSVDRDGEVFYIHDKDLKGWHRTSGEVEKTSIADLSDDNRCYVVWEVKDGRRTGKFEVTNQSIASLDEMCELLKRNKDQCILNDCRDDDPPAVVAKVSHLTDDIRGRMLVQVLGFKIRDGAHLVEEVEKLDPAPDWKTRVKFVPSPHPHSLAAIAGVPQEQLTVEMGTNAAINWCRSFEKVGLTVVGYHGPRNNAASGYKNDNLATFKGRYITSQPDLQVFIQDKILEQVQHEMQKEGVVPWISPSARPTWTDKDGNHYMSGFHDPDKLKMLDLNVPAADFFLQASDPANHYKLGVDMVVCDDTSRAAQYIADSLPI